MKPIALILAAYGVFLILIGLTGYLSNPEKAKTALMSGGTFGLLNIAYAWLSTRRPVLAFRAALGTAGFLTLVFLWRSTVSWMAFAGGQAEKLTAAVLITSMLLATIGLITFLLRNRNRIQKSAP